MRIFESQNGRIDVFTKTPTSSTLRTLLALLVLLVLVPAVFYSAYEINALTQSEHLVERLYRQQLDAALFSLNQYAWDIANTWASDVVRTLRATQEIPLSQSRKSFRELLSSNRSIQALFISDTSASSVAMEHSSVEDSTAMRFSENDFRALLSTQHPTVGRLMRLMETGYRKIEGVPISRNNVRQSTCLMFAVDVAPNRMLLAGVVLKAETFVREVLRTKLVETAGEDFILVVLQKDDNRQVFATGAITTGEERQVKDLWLFPNYSLGIRLKGQTIEELVRERFYRNISLLVVLDLMIVAGVWFVYRTTRREVELSQLKTDFVSNVSHELRTPLSLIRMFAETLALGRVKSEEKKQEYYDTIVRESERLTVLVNNVLNFSRMESGKKEYHFSGVNLNDVVEKVLSSYRAQAEHLGFVLETQMAAGTLSIVADEQAVAEAVLNVMDNAIKYSNAQKSITIRTGAAERNAYVEVTDRGVGIPPAEQSKIFDKFYRVSSGLVHETRGSGLGLTIVRHIMEAHKGEVSVRSRVGEGSTFRLSFPASA